MQQEHSAGFIVYRFSGGVVQYLLLHYTAGHWDFPKGHLEQGETSKQAALRELAEETGIDGVMLSPDWQRTMHYSYSSHGQQIAKQVDFFLGQVSKTIVTLSSEHQNFRWLPLDGALAQLTYENARQLLHIAAQTISSQSKSTLN